MHYELYLDSMFLLNLGMNLLLLIMVDHSTCRTATWYRLLCGAGIGAVCYLLPFLWKGAALLKLLLCMLPGTLLMLTVTFRIRNWRSLWSYFRKQMYDTFLLGGILVAVLRGIPAGIQYVPGIVLALGVGALTVQLLLWRYRRETELGTHCEVVLRGTEQTLCIAAIVDSGNTLTEPMSGAPVSVLDVVTFQTLWPEGLPDFRVIPYHSVGKKNGILYGYRIPQMKIRIHSVEKICSDVWLAVSEEEIAGREIPMLLHPALLKKTGKAGRSNYDLKDSNTRENAIQDDSQRTVSAAAERRYSLHRRRRGPATAASHRSGEPGDQ